MGSKRFFNGGSLFWATAALILLASSAAAWWWWGRGGEPPPGPSDAALAADPEVAAAVRTARQRVQKAPRSAEAWGLLGQVLLANGFNADADVCLGRAESLDPDEPRWPYLRAYGLSPDEARNRETAFAAAQRAVEACKRAGRKEPTAYLYLAEQCIARDDRDQAQALCRKVLDWEADNARAHLDMGFILGAADPAAAIPHLLRAAEAPTSRHTAYTQLAAAYERKGDEAAAADYARKARQAPPDEPWQDPFVDPMQVLTTGRKARRQLVEELEKRGRLRDAAALLRQTTADDPSDHHSLVVLGSLLSRLGDFEGAEQALEKAAALASQSPDPPYYLSLTLYAHGQQIRGRGDEAAAGEKFRAAADQARRAVDLKSDHTQAYGILGLALKQLGRRPEAVEAFRAAVRCRPEEAESHLQLGEALAEENQDAEALVQLQYACDLAGPDDARPRQALERVRAGHKPM